MTRLVKLALQFGITMVVITMGACRKEEPEVAFNRNLGDSDLRLLPMTHTVHAAHDPTILEGQTRAEVLKRGEQVSEPPTPATSGSGTTMTQPPAGQGNASGGILGAFASALLGRGGQAPTAPSGVPPGAAPPTGTVTPAVQQTVMKFNQAVQQLDFRAMPEFHVSSHRPQAIDFYRRYDTLSELVDVLASTLEREEPGSADKVKQRWNAYVDANLTVAPTEVPFADDNGQARIDIPVFSSASAMNPFRTAFDSLVDRLDAIETGVVDGDMDVAAALEAFDQALTQIAPSIKP